MTRTGGDATRSAGRTTHGRGAVDIDPDVYDRLTREAMARGVSIRWFTSKLLREALTHLRPTDEFKLTTLNGDEDKP